MALKAMTFESSVSISATSVIDVAVLVSGVTLMVVLYSLVEPSELVAKMVMLLSNAAVNSALSNTVT